MSKHASDPNPKDAILVPAQDIEKLMEFLKSHDRLRVDPISLQFFCSWWEILCLRILFADIVERFVIMECVEAKKPMTKNFAALISGSEVDVRCYAYQIITDAVSRTQYSDLLETPIVGFKEKLLGILFDQMSEMGASWGVSFSYVGEAPRNFLRLTDKYFYSELPEFDYNEETKTLMIIHPTNGWRYPLNIGKEELWNDGEFILHGDFENYFKAVALLPPEKEQDSLVENEPPTKAQKV